MEDGGIMEHGLVPRRLQRPKQQRGDGIEHTRDDTSNGAHVGPRGRPNRRPGQAWCGTVLRCTESSATRSKTTGKITWSSMGDSGESDAVGVEIIQRQWRRVRGGRGGPI